MESQSQSPLPQVPPPTGPPGESRAPAPEQGRVRYGKLAAGLLLVVLGGLLLLERYITFDVDELWRWAPLVLVVLGTARLLTGGEPRARRGGLWLLFTGGWLLANLFEVGGMDFGESWPLWVVFAGVSALLFPDPGSSRLDGLWPLGIGLWLQVNVLQLGGLHWGNSWPLLLIAVGVGIVSKALSGPRRLGGEES